MRKLKVIQGQIFTSYLEIHAENHKYFPNILLFGFYNHKHGQIQRDQYHYSSKHKNFPRILQYMLGLWLFSEGKSFSFLVLQKFP